MPPPPQREQDVFFSTIVCLQLEAKRCFIKMQRELLLYERMKYIVSGKLMSN